MQARTLSEVRQKKKEKIEEIQTQHTILATTDVSARSVLSSHVRLRNDEWMSGNMYICIYDIYYISHGHNHSYTLSPDVLMLSMSAFLVSFSPLCVLLHFKLTN